jgi:hypothetical protein
MRKAYVFISSSADARLERQRVSRLLEKLNVDFADAVTFEPVRWEDRIYGAHAGFQEQIRKSTSCDVVIAILRGRIGMPLSRAFIDQLPAEERLFQGLPTPTGTVYEILTAIAARRRGEKLPDIYAFRYAHAPLVSLDAQDRAEVETQWRQLQDFIAHVFMTPEGSIKGALERYGSLDEFEAKAERAMRQWLGENVAAAQGAAWPIERNGSPFRGLEPFGARHADVFFGRRADLRRALARLRLLAAEDLPFLTIVGPSGAGKSSFVRASLVPTLVKPGVVEGIGVWRVVLTRPGDEDADPIANLARRLYDGPEDLPSSERGRPCALPELRQGDSPRPQDLCELFRLFAESRQADEARRDSLRRAASAPLLRALGRVAESEKGRTGGEAEGRARLLVVVDQLDELLALKTSNEAIAGFARLLEALAATGEIWIVATLRADALGTFLVSPFAGRSSAATGPGGSEADRLLALAPPGITDFGDVVRGPAAAAGLEWERDPVSGQRLDDKVLEDVDRPDLLPLLQFVLQELFEQRRVLDGKPTLTWLAYRQIGHLDGAIATAARRALGRLQGDDAAALPRLLRTLVAHPRVGVEPSQSGPMVLRVPRPRVDADPHVKALADALIDARILVSAKEQNGQATVALAHQRVLEAWEEARKIIEDNRTLLRGRDAIQAAHEAWKETRTADRLIRPGSLLWEAERVAATLKDELTADERRFVAASGSAARRRQRAIAAAAGVFAVVSVVALISAYFFFDARNRAEHNLAAAKRAIAALDDFIWKANQGAQDRAGFSVGAVGASLAEVSHTLDDLAAEAPADLDLLAVRASNFANLVDAFRALHSAAQAREAATQGVATAALMAKLAPSDVRTLKAETMAAYKMADVQADAVDRSGAIREAREAERLARELAARVADAPARRLLWVATEKLGEALLETRDPDAAPTLARAEGMARALVGEAHGGLDRTRDLAVSLAGEGRAALAFGKKEAALKYASEYLALARQLVGAQPSNALFARDETLADLAEGMAKWANADRTGARVDLDAAAATALRRTEADPLDATAKHDLLTVLTTRAQLLVDEDKSAARTDLDQALELARDFVRLDGDTARSKFDLAKVLLRRALDFTDAASDVDEARTLIAGLTARGLLTDRDEAALAQIEALLK